MGTCPSNVRSCGYAESKREEAWWSGVKELAENLGAKQQFLGIRKDELKNSNFGQ